MPTNPAASDSTDDPIALLESFVTDNDDLLSLEERIGRFNVFDALGIVRREVQHSNFLAWLLSPVASHGQGDLFLKAVLMDVFRHARRSGVSVPMSSVHLDGGNLDTFEVRREWNQIDLLLVDPESEIVIAVENKVDSGEHSNQLHRYEEVLDREFAGWRRLLVFLTPGGEPASNPAWVPYSYKQIHAVIERAKRTSGGALGIDVGTFVDHYLNLLETRLMDDPKIAELCRRIYSNHRRAIDLIVEQADVGTAGLMTPVAEAVEKLPGGPWLFPNRTGRMFRCIPESWTKIIPPVALQVPNPHALLFYEVWVDANKTTVVTLTVSPCRDREMRLKLVEHLRSEATTLGLKSTFKATLDSEWTRLISYHPYRWTDEPVREEAAAKTLKVAQDLLSKVEAVTESLRRFFKNPAK